MPRRRSPAARRRRREQKSLTLADEWRVWVVDNLLAGASPSEVIDGLVDSRVPEELARSEVAAILRSPSLVACQRQHRRLQQLQQLVRLQRSLAQYAPEPEQIERRGRIPADEFFRHYYGGNRPVVLTDVVPHWPAFGRWTPDYFEQAYGSATIEVVSGRADDPHGDRNFDRYRHQTTMADYVAQVRAAGESNDLYMIAHNQNMLREPLLPLLDDVALDDTIFDPQRLRGGVTLWFGPAGTVTPLHHDTTNILFCQLHGRKRFHLISPWETRLFAGADGFYSEWDLEDDDALPALQAEGVTVRQVELQAGEALFIPAGWWHHVKALDISISFSLLNFRRGNSFAWYRPGHPGD